MKRSGPSLESQSKKLHPFFNQKSVSKAAVVEWKADTPDSLLVCEFNHSADHYNLTAGQELKLALFDLDSTIAKTKGNHRFHKNADDWQFVFGSIPNKLQQLHENGHKIAIISNQSGLSKDSASDKVNVFKQRATNILKALNIPLVLLAAKDKDRFRKPSLGMLDYYLRHYGQGTVIDKDLSFVVGDAAGRPKGWKTNAKEDFSCSDRKFALNAQLKFHTPEEYFLKEKTATYSLGFDPNMYIGIERSLFTPTSSPLKVKNIELLIFVGCPASGKSTFAKRTFADYGYVNRDTLGSKKKCLQQCRDFLENGQSCIVDNTNPEVSTRREYIDIAQEYKVKVRCFYFAAEKDLCIHNDRFRSIEGTEGREMLSSVVFNSYFSRFQEPTVSEGFSSIKTINFKPRFASEEIKNKWKMFYI